MRIRNKHIRRIAEERMAAENHRRAQAGKPRLSKRERDQVRSRLLRLYLICNLSRPKVELRNRRLPDDGEVFQEGQPATNLPDDTPVGVVEALVRRYTSEEDSVCILYGRSTAALEATHRLGRRPVLVDPYADCLHTGFRATWRPELIIDELHRREKRFDGFRLLLFHLPAPGIVDREDFLYPDVDPPDRPVHWESLTRNHFVDLFEKRVRQWEPTVMPHGRVAVLSTPSRFPETNDHVGSESPVHPFVRLEMKNNGWRLERRHPIHRPTADAPMEDPVLQRASLGVYTRGGNE